MLNRAWVAFQLSSLSQCETNLGDPFIVEFVCPGVCPTDGYTICTPSDVEDIRAGYNRTQQEAVKKCIDAILIGGGLCTGGLDSPGELLAIDQLAGLGAAARRVTGYGDRLAPRGPELLAARSSRRRGGDRRPARSPPGRGPPRSLAVRRLAA